MQGKGKKEREEIMDFFIQSGSTDSSGCPSCGKKRLSKIVKSGTVNLVCSCGYSTTIPKSRKAAILGSQIEKR